jgi:beta-lactam-binding protein with PASTA domain
MIIRNLGLVIESVDSAFSDSLPLGKIMKTVPEVETEVKKGDALRVVVSRGFILRMPDLLGLTLNEARGVLKNMGLTLGEIQLVEASGTKGNIIIQHPEPEQVVSIGDTVNVLVIK